LSLRLWSNIDCIFCILVYAYDHIVTLLSDLCLRLWSHNKYIAYICLRLWAHTNSIINIWVYVYDHILTAFSAVVFTHMAHNNFIVNICVYAFGIKITLCSLLLFTLMIIFLLYCQHLFSRLWSHRSYIVSICDLTYDYFINIVYIFVHAFDISNGTFYICFYAYDHIATPFSILFLRLWSHSNWIVYICVYA